MSTDKILVQQGTQVARIDGHLKVTGTATYASDTHYPHLAFAVPVCATIGKGRIVKMDATEAQKLPGVLAIYSHGHIGKLYRPAPPEGMKGRIDEARPPFEDEIIRYYGQYVAVVVAETLEIAEAASHLVNVTYKAETPNLEPRLTQEDEKKIDSHRGDAKAAFDRAAYKVNETYVTPVEAHNPIELHSTVAFWDGDHVTLNETSQAINNHQYVLAQILGVRKENVRVVSKFLGSGFGGKLWPWTHSALAAIAAKELKRPVKLVVDRRMMFTSVGHRPRTQQLIELSSTANGKLTSIHHSYASEVSILDHYKENCGEFSAFLYSCPNVLVTSGLARRNVGTPTSMRGPGAVPGLFALESALDELAIKLRIDPVKLRLQNDTQTDESANRPFSSRHLKECLELGSKKFGWEKRTPAVGSMKDGDEILGWGVSSCTWAARRLDCDASVDLLADGRARVSCGTQDIGTGTYTVIANVVHEETGIPLSQIEVLLGDTNLPPGPLSGGSMATASVISGVAKATQTAVKSLLQAASESPLSPFHGEKVETLDFKDGRIQNKKNESVTLQELLTKLNMSVASGTSQVKGTMATEKEAKTTLKSFGAHFVEIAWHPGLARLRVRRVVSVIDGGKIINFMQAKNQIEGAVVMGIGMGMFEEAIYDARDGHPINNNLADYIVPSHADMPNIDVTFLDYPDKELNEYGARGVGEIGLAGIAASICNAVYHATGVRVREIPVKIENLLKA